MSTVSPGQYLGCYGDNLKVKAMAKNIGIVASIQACSDLAIAAKYSLFGLQNGNECWVSNNTTRSEMYGQCGQCTKCSRPACSCAKAKCASGENCGDALGFALYSIASPSSKPSRTPTCKPTSSSPSMVPSFEPTSTPTGAPSSSPTSEPSVLPTYEPTSAPSSNPTSAPMKPTIQPTNFELYHYLGCYGDNVVGRSMTKNIGLVASVLGCYNLALSKGYKVYALQNGKECWASNNLTRAEMYGQCGKCTKCSRPACNCAKVKCASGENCGDGYGNALYTITPLDKFPTLIPTQAPVIPPTVMPSETPSSEPTFEPTVFPTLEPTFSPPTFEPTFTPTNYEKYRYLGCYGDNIKVRAMTKSLGLVTSVKSCYILAASKGYKVYGLQNGGECWVSNNLTKAEIYGQCGKCTKCTKPTCNCASMKCLNGDNCGDYSTSSLYLITSTSSAPSLAPIIAKSTNLLKSSAPSRSPSSIPSLPSATPTIGPTSTPTGAPSFVPTEAPSTFVPSSEPTIETTSNPSARPTNFELYRYLGCYGDNVAGRSMTKNIGLVTSVLGCYNLAFSKGYKIYGLQNGKECWASNNLTKAEMYGQCGQCTKCSRPACNCAKVKCASGENCGDGYANALYMITRFNNFPTLIPTQIPTLLPTFSPSDVPTFEPTVSPSDIPTIEPTDSSYMMPTVQPTDFEKYHYLGCYGDGFKTRAMTKNIGLITSVTDCYNLALSKGYNVYGIQNGRECWVSNNVTRSEMYGQCGKCVGCAKPTCNCATKKCASGENCGDYYANSLYTITPIGKFPTLAPTDAPVFQSTDAPVFQSTSSPTSEPSAAITESPTLSTVAPTQLSTIQAAFHKTSARPSKKPIVKSSLKPSSRPSNHPILRPVLTHRPSKNPIFKTISTHRPSKNPISIKTIRPSIKPVTKITLKPVAKPTKATLKPVAQPTLKPIAKPTKATLKPVAKPTLKPIAKPTKATLKPVAKPTKATLKPVAKPTLKPIAKPTKATLKPVAKPTLIQKPSTRPR